MAGWVEWSDYATGSYQRVPVSSENQNSQIILPCCFCALYCSIRLILRWRPTSAARLYWDWRVWYWCLATGCGQWDRPIPADRRFRPAGFHPRERIVPPWSDMMIPWWMNHPPKASWITWWAGDARFTKSQPCITGQISRMFNLRLKDTERTDDGQGSLPQICSPSYCNGYAHSAMDRAWIIGGPGSGLLAVMPWERQHNIELYRSSLKEVWRYPWYGFIWADGGRMAHTIRAYFNHSKKEFRKMYDLISHWTIRHRLIIQPNDSFIGRLEWSRLESVIVFC